MIEFFCWAFVAVLVPCLLYFAWCDSTGEFCQPEDPPLRKLILIAGKIGIWIVVSLIYWLIRR